MYIFNYLKSLLDSNNKQRPLSDYNRKFNQQKNYDKENENNNQKIFINNFKQNLTEDDLNKFCTKYGQINYCKIYKDEFGRNYAIVEYLNKENANSALKNLPNEIPNENNSKLIIELYQNKFE